jgi:hypothetical protein
MNQRDQIGFVGFLIPGLDKPQLDKLDYLVTPSGF